VTPIVKPLRERWWTRLGVAAALLCTGNGAVGQVRQGTGDMVWEIVAERPPALAGRTNIAGPFAIVRLNKTGFDARMNQAPLDRDLASSDPVVLSLPMSDGSFARFRVADSPILAPELTAAFPQIRTYTGQGVDDPTATTRFGWTDAGFHAVVLSSDGVTYIDPYVTGDVELYIAAEKAGVQRSALPFVCQSPENEITADRALNEFPIANGASLRTYRLALAATGEYTTAAGGTKAQALSRMVATINRVDGIYERELAVRFTLATGTAGDPTALIYTNASTDPYTNSSGSTMLGQNQTNIDAVVGSANYDFGHVFSTGGGGVASLGSVCRSTTKARGVTGSTNPVGDGFDVDYVAHEMGHQFGANHTFNGTAGNCGANRSSAHASEVGSGSTIQSYSGICSVENLQLHSDDYFTFESLNEMTAFITSGSGASCGAASSTGNSVPVVSAGSSYTIPVRTPFTLTASASDANGDALTYNWEQWSLNGTASSSVASASTDSGTNPIVRSYLPATSASRTVPALTYILNNANVPPQTYSCSGSTCLTGEILPTTNRTITFHVTVRDNRANGSAIATASMTVTSTTAAGPFAVTAPNSAVTATGGTALAITWNVANTTATPISAANVSILLSTDGGATFPTVLAASTPNDGSQSVTIPDTPTTSARIKVAAVGNIFFDVSNSNFSIVANAGPVFTDDPLTPGSTPVKAIHVTELRQAIDTLRTRFGLAPFAWTDETIVAGSTVVKATHMTELRSALQAVYAAAGRAAPTYTQPTVAPATTVISAVDVAELRAAIRAVW
jgi:hypothetical protein